MLGVMGALRITLLDIVMPDPIKHYTKLQRLEPDGAV